MTRVHGELVKTRRSIRQWPPWVWILSGLLAVGIVVTAVLAWSGGTDTVAPELTMTQAAATSATTTTTTTPTPTTTLTTTTAPTTTTTTRQTAATTTKTSPGTLPEIVVASAGSGGGSGEVAVEWNPAARATGYRVYRTDSAGHNARLMADINIISGHTTVAAGVVNIWSKGHSYLPNRGPLTGPDRSTWFQYIDVGEQITRYYRVRAYNAAGAGPLSALTSGLPVLGPPPSLPTPTTPKTN